ncbi:hypothetical protein CEP54_004558 [Fusarium duplospermum]|uniref:BZIP domain-containing protein n=1 Tax=Fusarium duplospermum TaxID=1325734 RepID=A0A428QHC9_9HYPO|nr:hypothetical protein CEP54_004558 [Fusarium duplospermum]
MDSSNNFADESNQFGNNYMLAATDDTNIDPMLNACTTEDPIPNPSRPMDTQFMMNPAMWNPALNNPVGFFPPELSNVVPTTSTVSPRPPTEAQSSPGTTSSEPVFETSRTSSKSSIPSVNSIASEKNTKARKSTRSTNSHRRRASAASPPRRPTAVKESVVQEDEEEEDIDDGESSKRSKFLKRNRIAASKCRQKKKEWVNNLEETRYGLEHQHSTLQTEYNDLLGEVSKMKNQLMQHAGCNDSNINQWIENEARKFVQRTAAEYQTGHAHCTGINCCHHNHRRRSSSVMTTIPKSTESEINYDHMPDDMLD